MISRRSFLQLSGLATVVPSLHLLPSSARSSSPPGAPKPDHSLEIGSLALEIAPRRTVKTTAYNGQVPGPLLRLKENQPATIDVVNRSARPEVVHWHGLRSAPEVDGALEEGTPPIAPDARVRYTLTPQPSGFRWYHTHTMAMNDLTLAQYGGQHGFLMVEPRAEPGRYDQEFFLALHDWDGQLIASDDGGMNPRYGAATINGKVMGHGEPLRVKQGQHILLHVLNSSPTEVHWLAFAGHRMRVIALDGNAVANPQLVSMLRLAPAERICAVVEMNNPGVWVLGEVRKHVQALGMAVAVEYEARSGNAQWLQPADLNWNYAQFAATDLTHQLATADAAGPPIVVPLVFESKFQGHGSMESWLINGAAYPRSGIAPLTRGRRYRLQFINKSMDDHPLHLHRHSFELRTVGAPLAAPGPQPTELRGIVKDVVLVDAQTRTEVEFVADNPGATLFHCHQQNHMDLGFMMLLRYA